MSRTADHQVIANKVCRLVLAPNRLGRFREQIWSHKQHVLKRAESRQLDRASYWEHCRQALVEERLRDRKAGPPQSSARWCRLWNPYALREGGESSSSGAAEWPPRFSAWLPHELCVHHLEPEQFEPQRAKDWSDVLAACYVRLAIVHDRAHRECPAIIEPEPENISKDALGDLTPWGWELAEDIEVSDRYRPELLDYDLEAVRADLDQGDNGMPKDLISTRVAIERFVVSRSTLKRCVYGKKLRSYRRHNAPPNAEHVFSEAAVAALFERRRRRLRS
jgi:hypothetical protein